MDDSEAFKSLVRTVIKESLTKLEGEPAASERSIRWELGSCWVQYLQKQETDLNSMRPGIDNEVEYAVKGLRKQFKFLKKRDNKPNRTNEEEENDTGPCRMNVENTVEQNSNGELNSEMELKKLISEEAFLRLKESGTGLHLKVSESISNIFATQKLKWIIFFLYLFTSLTRYILVNLVFLSL